MSESNSFLQLLIERVIYNKDTKVKDAGSYIIQKEDHTLGNILRIQLLRDRSVLFAGYKFPHPLETHIVVKIQTTPDTSPQRVMQEAVSHLINEVSSLEAKFMVCDDLLLSKQEEVNRKKHPDQEMYL